MALTAYAIQNRLFETLMRKGHELICPNITPKGWFESDVFSMTKAGYFVEHEIKLTVQDFERDARKGGGTKHRRLADGDTDGPKYFWFVIPEELEGKIECPAWAGLKLARMHGKRVRLRIVRQAPSRHSAKVGDVVRRQVADAYYWRFWALRRK